VTAISTSQNTSSRSLAAAAAHAVPFLEAPSFANEVQYLEFTIDHHYSALRITELAAGTSDVGSTSNFAGSPDVYPPTPAKATDPVALQVATMANAAQRLRHYQYTIRDDPSAGQRRVPVGRYRRGHGGAGAGERRLACGGPARARLRAAREQAGVGGRVTLATRAPGVPLWGVRSRHSTREALISRLQCPILRCRHGSMGEGEAR